MYLLREKNAMLPFGQSDFEGTFWRRLTQLPSFAYQTAITIIDGAFQLAATERGTAISCQNCFMVSYFPGV
jgi:hypothetical protein